MAKEGYTNLVNSIIPRLDIFVLVCGHIGDIVKMHNFIKSRLYYSYGLSYDAQRGL